MTCWRVLMVGESLTASQNQIDLRGRKPALAAMCI